MVEYGYINENGYLVSKILEDHKERYLNENGEVEERVISCEKQAEELIAHGWKPVDHIDESKLTLEGYYCVDIIPYDNGDRITFKYEKILDRRAIAERVKTLKGILSADDYKIIKSYEASLVGDPLPYDIKKLRELRESIRGEINTLENMLE